MRNEKLVRLAGWLEAVLLLGALKWVVYDGGGLLLELIPRLGQPGWAALGGQLWRCLVGGGWPSGWPPFCGCCVNCTAVPPRCRGGARQVVRNRSAVRIGGLLAHAPDHPQNVPGGLAALCHDAPLCADKRSCLPCAGSHISNAAL